MSNRSEAKLSPIVNSIYSVGSLYFDRIEHKGHILSLKHYESVQESISFRCAKCNALFFGRRDVSFIYVGTGARIILEFGPSYYCSEEDKLKELLS